MKSWLITIFTIALLTQSLKGDCQLFKQHRFHTLNERDGLHNTIINDVLQDSLGQIWVGTEEGLYRYQGLSFQKFIRDSSNPYSLHNNYIKQLFLDDSNNVWLMTDDGVGFYSYERDAINRFMPEEIKGRISSMAIDESGSLYFGKYESGILRVRNGNAEILNLHDPITGIDFGNYSILELEINEDFLWANVSDIGVLRYKLSSQKIDFFSANEIAGQEKIPLTDLHLDENGDVWLGTGQGVYRLFFDEQRIKRIDRSLELVLPKDDYLSIFQESESKTLWVGSRQNGLYSITNPKSDNPVVSMHFTPRDDLYGISHRTISKVFKERSGKFWLGTHNGGINIFNPEGEEVRAVTKLFQPFESALDYQNVWGLAESQDGNLWIGTDGGGISLLNPSNGQVNNEILPELKNEAILCLHEDSKGRLWVGTYKSGVFLVANGLVKNFIKGKVGSDLWVNDIRTFYEIDGQIFIGTNQGGLYTFNEDTQEVKQCTGVPLWDIRSLISDDEGMLWIGTFGKGIIKYSPKDDKIVPQDWQKAELVVNAFVFDMDIDGDVLWLATRHNGVQALDVKSLSLQSFDKLQQIGSMSVSGIELDVEGNVWFTLNTGVFMFDRRTGQLRQFDQHEGFFSGHFNHGSILLSQAGYLALGGIHGLNLFYPGSIEANSPSEDILLTEFKIHNQVVNPTNSEVFVSGQSIFTAEELKISYQYNIFSIQFAYPGFGIDQNKNFMYQLKGYDERWQPANTENRATYRNVPPGKYTFKVKDGLGNNLRELRIEVIPPIWRTWQAITVYTLLVILLIWRINRFIHSRMALKQKLIFEQELREKEKATMQEKLRFYTNFSHELKTPLTLIQGPVADLIKKEKDPGSLQLLDMIRKNTRVLQKFINRMLEFRKIELNSTLLNVGYYDLYILGQEEIESFTHLAKEKGINLGFYCEQELLAWVDLEKLQIIITNLLSNALKYSPNNASVKFGMFHAKDHIMIEVKNKGLAIDKTERELIFSPFYQARNSQGREGTGIGLALCKSFVELHNGTIEVSLDQEGYTVFTVTLPKGKEYLASMDYVNFLDSSEDFSSEKTLPLEFQEINETEVLEEAERCILVVDDNEDIANYVRSIFIEEFRVLVCNNGEDALNRAVELIPDIIISDIMMPGIDGLEFCENIKNHFATSHIPVILLTAKNSEASKIKGFNVGADDYVTKPFSSDILKFRVNNLLSNRKLLELKYGHANLIDPNQITQSKEAAFILKLEEVVLSTLEHSDLAVPELAKEMGMSQTSLYKKVKSTTGDSVNSFIRKIKIKNAARLLLSTDKSVSEVCYSVYFSDPKYFRKCFKEQYDMSPTEYRKNHLYVNNL